MFELRNVHKKYDDVHALNDVSLSVTEAATTAVIGPSGCGKSTLLHVLNGIETVTSGDVLFKTKPLHSFELPRIRREMGYVIQEGGLFPHLTAKANVSVVAKLDGWTDAKINTRVDELRTLVQLDPSAMDRYPNQLSGGQRQRVGLMRALMLNPPALLMDEPLGALDPLTRSDLQSDLKTIFSELKKTVVIVTHDLAEAAYLGDTIVVLKEGHVEQQGTMEDLVNSPASPFVEHFVNAHRSLVIS